MMLNYSAAWFAGHLLLLFFIVGIVAFILHFLPSFIAFNRIHPHRFAILLLNFLFGWTVIAWIVLFIWAISEPARTYPSDSPPPVLR